jgi:hypothetical protein
MFLYREQMLRVFGEAIIAENDMLWHLRVTNCK